MSYYITIHRDDDVLMEREVSADEVIDLLTQRPAPPVDNRLIKKIAAFGEDIENGVYKPRFAPPPPSDMETARNNLAIKEAQAKSGKVCGECGQPGHNKRTCPTLRTDQPSKSIATDDPDWYYQDILDMLRDGVSEEEVYNTVTTSVTDYQYHEALEWAKEQLD